MSNLIKCTAVIIFFIVLTGSCSKEANIDKNTSPTSETIKKDPLPSWNDGSTKKEILAYVDAVTDKNNHKFIPIADRIATFDNDGNLWSEQPAYFQLFYAIDRVKEMAIDHPEWRFGPWLCSV